MYLFIIEFFVKPKCTVSHYTHLFILITIPSLCTVTSLSLTHIPHVPSFILSPYLLPSVFTGMHCLLSHFTLPFPSSATPTNRIRKKYWSNGIADIKMYWVTYNTKASILSITPKVHCLNMSSDYLSRKVAFSSQPLTMSKVTLYIVSTP